MEEYKYINPDNGSDTVDLNDTTEANLKRIDNKISKLEMQIYRLEIKIDNYFSELNRKLDEIVGDAHGHKTKTEEGYR